MNMFIKKKIRTNINSNEKNTIKKWLEKSNYTQNLETFYKHEYVCKNQSKPELIIYGKSYKKPNLHIVTHDSFLKYVFCIWNGQIFLSGSHRTHAHWYGPSGPAAPLPS